MLKRAIFITIGSLCLLLGGIGIAIPVLPTTPFVILASACFAYSSPRLYEWLARTKYFGDFIRNYKEKTGVQKSVKIKALLFLYCTLIISFLLSGSLHLRLFLLIVAFGVTIHILLIKNKPR